ncbi:hypothetical protein LGR51_16560 [Pseudomonas sp. NP21570]|uniref:hypothetical protein n=1 Tax=Pseudomonas sp. TaxID=306 RepID=UPI001E491A4A|nr:hypothetical protein [Pseudomonas sp.]MCB4796112.1 hypothetical protein [Pseudomonas sp. NP21570]
MSSDPTAQPDASDAPNVTSLHGKSVDAGAQAQPASDPLQNDVFSKMVESPEDFLGLLSYALYKRHKIEWLSAHPGEDQETFKKVACTPSQVDMYKNKAQMMAVSFVDVSMESLGGDMRDEIQKSEIIARIAALKPTRLAAFFDYMLSGAASVLVALLLFGVFSVYSKYQNAGGIEKVASEALQGASANAGTPQPAPATIPGALP